MFEEEVNFINHHDSHTDYRPFETISHHLLFQCSEFPCGDAVNQPVCLMRLSVGSLKRTGPLKRAELRNCGYAAENGRGPKDCLKKRNVVNPMQETLRNLHCFCYGLQNLFGCSWEHFYVFPFFSISWVSNHPNWRTHILNRGVAQPPTSDQNRLLKTSKRWYGHPVTCGLRPGMQYLQSSIYVLGIDVNRIYIYIYIYTYIYIHIRSF